MSNKKFNALYKYAKSLIKSGDHARARKVAQKIVSQYPDKPEGWLVLGGLSEPEKSIFYLEKAKRIAPDDQRVLAALSWAHEQIPESQYDDERVEPSNQIQVVSSQSDWYQESTKKQTSGLLKKISQNAVYRGFIHMLKKGVLIGITIFIGVFITITIMNREVVVGWGTAPAQLDATIEHQIDRTIDRYIRDTPSLRHIPFFERRPSRWCKGNRFRSGHCEGGYE